MFILPFSPRWLVEQGRHDEALAVVQRLHGDKHNKEFIDLEFAEMSVRKSTRVLIIDYPQARTNSVREGEHFNEGKYTSRFERKSLNRA
jgi:hypothetical protein